MTYDSVDIYEYRNLESRGFQNTVFYFRSSVPP